MRERCWSISERKRGEEEGESAGPPDLKALRFSALPEADFFCVITEAGKLCDVSMKQSGVNF